MKILTKKPIHGLLFLFVIAALILLFPMAVADVEITSGNNESSSKEEPVVKRANNLISNQPLRFVANYGQAGLDAKYHVQGAGHTILFYENEIGMRRAEPEVGQNDITLKFKDANQHPYIEGVDKLPGVAHFYVGSDPNQWHTNVPTYASVLYKELYPGIDMAYIGNDGILESEFYISPGIDYHQIKLNYQGITSKSVNAAGELVLKTELGELIEKTPYVYQDFEGARTEIDAAYVVNGDATIGFDLGDYNSGLPVVIDPEVVFMTTIHGQIGGGEWASGVGMDSEGNVLMTGVGSRFFPVTDTIEGSNHFDGLASGLLIKLDGTSGEVMYSALFGGSKADYFNMIAVDASDNIYFTGETGSEDFPTMNAFQDTIEGDVDAFLTVLNASGELHLSTYLGGSGRDVGEGLAVDKNGNVYVGGRTLSLDFPTIGGVQQELAGEADNFGDYRTDVFVTKFDAGGNVAYSTYHGGSEDEQFRGIVVDTSGQVTIAGTTRSEDLPLANAFQGVYGGVMVDWGLGDMFISRLSSSGKALNYSTYFGGESDDWSTGIALDANGHALISGGTTSEDFPVVDGESFPQADTSDGVVIRLDNMGQPVFALRTNKPGDDRFQGIGIDDAGRVLPVGGDHLETIIIYQLKDSESARSPLTYEEYLIIEAIGFAVNHILFHAGYVTLFACTVWDACGSSCRNAGVIKASTSNLEDLYDWECNGDTLSVKYKGPNDGRLTIGCSEDGEVTINGVPIGKDAEDIAGIEICGSEGDDQMYLGEVTQEKFPNIQANSPVPKIFIKGEGGDDCIVGAGDIDTEIQGGAGNDILTGGSGNDILSGDDGDDELEGNEGKDTMNGDDGDDYIDGGEGNDNIEGGDGKDDIIGHDGDDIVDGGSGDDEIEGDDGDDTINGGTGNDAINGGQGKDGIEGGSGNDQIDGGADDDQIDGGEGDDIILGGEGNDDLAGGSDNDHINGGTGDDSILGQGGNDVVNGGAGVDELDGGIGDDELDGGAGNDMVMGGEGNDGVSGGTGNDNLSGGNGNDNMSGDEGNDTIEGGSGDDFIFGGDGEDIILGGEGNDDIIAGTGDDMVDGGVGNDQIAGGEGNDGLSGGTGDDIIEGGDGEDLILGGAGEDEMNGGSDNDELQGGEGDDLIIGGNGDDDLRGNQGEDELQGGPGSDFLHGGEGNDMLFGDDGDDELQGGFGNDSLEGNDGADNLDGGPGNDHLSGDAGDEVVEGGSGGDVFELTDDPAFSTHILNSENNIVPSLNPLVDFRISVLLTDSSGVDTLNFSSYERDVIIDLTLLNSEQIIDASGTAIFIEGVFESVIGSAFDDIITISPFPDTTRFVDGGNGNDTLNYEIENAQPVDDGFTIKAPGYADVSYINIETVTLPIVSAIVQATINDIAISNYPNPFSTSTTIQYNVMEHAHVKLNIYNNSGKLLHSLVDSKQPPGKYEVQWRGYNVNGQKLSGGVYFYVFEAGAFMSSGKIVLIR